MVSADRKHGPEALFAEYAAGKDGGLVGVPLFPSQAQCFLWVEGSQRHEAPESARPRHSTVLPLGGVSE